MSGFQKTSKSHVTENNFNLENREGAEIHLATAVYSTYRGAEKFTAFKELRIKKHISCALKCV